MEKIEAQLKKITPELSMHESAVLWSRIEGNLSPRHARSPKRNPRTRRSLFRIMTAGTVIVGLLGGSVITAYASESLPGDTLYSAKITIERAQIALAPVEKKKDLQLAFADRRMKEVTAVLADIEEEESTSVVSPDPTLMAVALPTPEVALFSAPGVPEEAITPISEPVATMAMTASDVPENNRETTQDARIAKSRSMPVDDTPAPIVVSASAPREAIQEEKINTKQGKRWKNLDKKKKAITVAIKELERSRKELQKSGATSTSDRVDEVIVGLTELNTTGTTADDSFVERMKQREEEISPVEIREEKSESEVEKKEEEHEATLAPKEEAPVQLSVDASIETEEEIEEVKARNSERKKRFQAQVINVEGRPISGLWKGETKGKRVPVCFDSGKALRELLVPEKDISKYLEHGFTRGECPEVATTTLPADED